MSQNKTNMYDIEPHVAEIYDQQENYTDDITLIQNLIGKRKSLRILEPFCGTGRILIPLACDGHELVGFDQAQAMLDCAQEKLNQLPDEVNARVNITQADVLAEEWPREFDLVILGGNCLYELAAEEEQESCIAHASASLRPGGYIFLDNNHMEGPLYESWQRLDTDDKAFPTGLCQDGTVIQTSRKRIWYDIPQRLVRYHRRTVVTFPDGRQKIGEYLIQCHPPSRAEMQTWLEKNGFTIEQLYGGRDASPYEDTSNRAIFWAVKT